MRPGVRPDVRPGVWPDVRPDVRAAPVSSEGEEKNAGGPGGGSPPAKSVKGGVWGGEAPQPKPKIFRKILKKFTGGTYVINLLIGYKI